MPRKEVVNHILQVISEHIKQGDASDKIVADIINKYPPAFLENVHKFINLSRPSQMKLIEIDNVKFIVTNLVILKEILELFNIKYQEMVVKPI